MSTTDNRIIGTNGVIAADGSRSMRVEMTASVQGFDNAILERGAIFTLPDHFALSLILSGRAKRAPDPADPLVHRAPGLIVAPDAVAPDAGVIVNRDPVVTNRDPKPKRKGK